MPTNPVLPAVQKRLEEIERELGRLTSERRRLLAIIREYDQPIRREAKVTPSRGRMGLSKAILALLERNPGLRSAEVADRLEDDVHTTRKDPRRAIVARLYELRDAGTIFRDDGGRLFMNSQG